MARGLALVSLTPIPVAQEPTMSIASSLTPRSPHAVARVLVGAEARYFTDGASLFRRTTALNRCPAGFVWLEDCRSLTVVLSTAGELAQLTPVHAADNDPEPQ
jgi:hypothetical protein